MSVAERSKKVLGVAEAGMLAAPMRRVARMLRRVLSMGLSLTKKVILAHGPERLAEIWSGPERRVGKGDWHAGRESNPQPTDLESVTLPIAPPACTYSTLFAE